MQRQRVNNLYIIQDIFVDNFSTKILSKIKLFDIIVMECNELTGFRVLDFLCVHWWHCFLNESVTAL